jgi:hypothetical protein
METIAAPIDSHGVLKRTCCDPDSDGEPFELFSSMRNRILACQDISYHLYDFKLFLPTESILPLNPRSRMGKIQVWDSRSEFGINIPDHISQSLVSVLVCYGLKIRKFFVADTDLFPGSGAFLSLDPGSGIRGGKILINIPDTQHCV